MIAVIKSVEAGRTVKDVCRDAGISEATYYSYTVQKYSIFICSER
ncbi:transposase [Salmonella enterica]